MVVAEVVLEYGAEFNMLSKQYVSSDVPSHL